MAQLEFTLLVLTVVCVRPGYLWEVGEEPSLLQRRRSHALGSFAVDEKTCDEKIGVRMLEEQKQKVTDICKPTTSDGQASRLLCARHPQIFGLHCSAHNLRLDTRKLTQRQHGSLREDAEFYTTEYGAFSLEDCEETGGGVKQLRQTVGKKGKPPEQDVFLSKLRINTAQKHCEVYINQTTYMPIRSDYANVFFQIMEFFNAYKAGYIFGTDPREWQTVFLDAHGPAPTDEAWKAGFSRGHDLLRLDDIRQAYPGKTVCFREVLFNPISYESELFHVNKVCPGNPLLSQFRNFMVESFGIKPETKHLPVLTMLWRKDYQSHPRMSGKITRKITNEADVVDTLNRGSGFEVNHVDFARMSFKEQLEVVAHTDVFVANHGAGIMMAAFAPPSAVVIEIIPKITYSFLSRMRYVGHRYLQMDAERVEGKLKDTTVDVGKLMTLIDASIRTVRGQILGHVHSARSMGSAHLSTAEEYAFCGLCLGKGSGPVLGVDTRHPHQR